jgi:hypothetical protein
MALKTLLLALALTVPSMGTAQPAAAPPSRSQFQSLWTPWNGVTRQSLKSEAEEIDRVRQEVATAGAERQAALRNEGRALGERVGEIVRAGDCEDGERVARLAGDFALVEAVRNHCRQFRPQAQTVSSHR